MTELQLFIIRNMALHDYCVYDDELNELYKEYKAIFGSDLRDDIKEYNKKNTSWCR